MKSILLGGIKNLLKRSRNMKRKVLSILFALVLVLSFSLVTAVPAGAQETLEVIPFSLEYKNDQDASASWSALEGEIAVLLDSGPSEADGDEGRIVIDAADVGIAVLGDINTISWYEYLEEGYPPHVDVILDMGGSVTDALVIEYAYNTEAHSGTTAATGDWYQTFNDDIDGPAEIDDTANAWLSSGAPGALGDEPVGVVNYADVSGQFIYGTLAEWKAGTEVTEITSSTPVLRLEIEVDNWIVVSEAYVDDIEINDVTYYGSIQDAVDTATGGDTISVAAGTYVEDVDVDVAGITIQGESLDAIVVGGFLIKVDGITIDGFTIEGGCTGAAGFGAIVVEGESDNHIITNNVLIGLDEQDTYGIDLSKLSDSVLIDGNVSSNWEYGIYLRSNCSNVTVSDNEVYDNLKVGISVAYSTDCVVTENDVHGNNTLGLPFGNGGIVVYQGSDLLPYLPITVSNNEIYDNLIAGIDLGFTEGPCVVTENDIHDNNTPGSVDGAGIIVYAGVGGHLVNYNDIYDNGNKGLNVTGGAPLVYAENNWWGNPSGPELATLPEEGYESYGDKVSDDVIYEPWLLEGWETAATFEKTLALRDGWTLVSSDKEVTTDTAWVGTDILSGSDTILAYKYTPGSGFPQVTLATDLTSVDAYYIKTDGGGGVGINYSTSSPGVVTKDLDAGWNIISCAGETDAYTLLSQLRYVQIGEQEGVGVTNLIGQATYGQYTATSLSEPLATTGDWTALGSVALNAFDGYWVYMNAAKSFGVIPD